MATDTVRMAELPEDLQALLEDLADDAGVALPARLPLRSLPVAAFPPVEVGRSRGDGRGQAYIEAMRGQDLPPLVITEGVFIDGRHRLSALRLEGIQEVLCLDLTGILPVPAVPNLGPLLCEPVHPRPRMRPLNP